MTKLHSDGLLRLTSSLLGGLILGQVVSNPVLFKTKLLSASGSALVSELVGGQGHQGPGKFRSECCFSGASVRGQNSHSSDLDVGTVCSSPHAGKADQS